MRIRVAFKFCGTKAAESDRTKVCLPMAMKNDISKDILNYLFKHPESSDTIEGITEWWLLSQRIHDQVRKIKEAVSRLVEDGWLIEIKGRDSQIRYRFNPERKSLRNRLLIKR